MGRNNIQQIIEFTIAGKRVLPAPVKTKKSVSPTASKNCKIPINCKDGIPSLYISNGTLNKEIMNEDSALYLQLAEKQMEEAKIHLDNIFSKGVIALIGMLALISAGIVIVLSLLVWGIDITTESNLIDQFWKYSMIVLKGDPTDGVAWTCKARRR